MTPLELQDELAEEMKRIFKDYLYKNQAGERIPINVFTQNVPIHDTDDEEEPVPYIIVRLKDGDDEGTRDSFNVVNIIIIVGICDNDLNAQGHRDVMNIIQKIYMRFHENPDLNHKAAYKGPFHWATQEDNYYPFYFGACSMSFNIAAIRREDIFA